MVKKAALAVVEVADATKHRSTADNLTHIAGYPTKLVIYQLAASPFWWARYYADGKILRRSTKETGKKEAIKFAKEFYDDINHKRHMGYVLNSRADFLVCANAVIEQQDAKVARGEMSAMMNQNDKYRLQKEVLPFFQNYDLKNIDYFAIEKFIDKLGNDKLVAATRSNYLGLLRKILSYAQRKGFIQSVPQFPKQPKADAPRGWFNTHEFDQIRRAARRLVGQTWEIRKREVGGKSETFAIQRFLPGAKLKPTAEQQALIANSVLTKRVEMTVDIWNLIVFMTNSFIRPTDVKWAQHKHIEIIENDNTYLRMSLPISKKHDKPIVTMGNAVKYYRRQKAHYEALGKAGKEDYLFMPTYGREKAEDTKEVIDRRRGSALTQLQRQFTVVLAVTDLANGARGEERTLYSLRHTCIMYRLMYGEGMDLLTLARNARTSAEMIERFYASHLTAEMNIDMIQSRRSKKRKLKAKSKADDGKDHALDKAEAD
jgi:hypothetical protein